MSDLLKADAQFGPDGAAALWVGDTQAPYATGMTEAEMWSGVVEVARNRGTVLLTVYPHEGEAAAYTVDEHGTRIEQTGQNSYVKVAAAGTAGNGWDDLAPTTTGAQPITVLYDPLPQTPKPKTPKASKPSPKPEPAFVPEATEPVWEPRGTSSAQADADDVKARLKNIIDADQPAAKSPGVGNSLFTRKFLTIGAVSLVAMVAAITVVVGLFSNPALPDKPVVVDSPVAVVIGEPATGKLPFGFSQENWTRTIDAKAAVSTFPAAVVMVTDGNLELLSTLDGKTIRTEKGQGTVSFVVATQLGNGPAVAWKANGKLYAWDQQIGAKGKLIEVPLGSTDEVSNTGTAIMVRTPTTVSRLTSEGLKKLPSDPAVPVLAADVDGTTLASGFTGPLVSTDAAGAATEVSLVKPRAGWKVYKWISATTKLAVVAWAQDPDAVTGETRILIAVHDAKTGESTATIEADESSLQDWKFTTGKSSERAIYGPYMFDLGNGKLIADGTKAGVDFTDVAGRFGLGDTVRGTVVVEGVSAIPTTAIILGLTGEGGMVVRTSSTLLTSFTTEAGLLS